MRVARRLIGGRRAGPRRARRRPHPQSRRGRRRNPGQRPRRRPQPQLPVRVEAARRRRILRPPPALGARVAGRARPDPAHASRRSRSGSTSRSASSTAPAATSRSSAATRSWSGLPLVGLRRYPGSASSWQNHAMAEHRLRRRAAGGRLGRPGPPRRPRDPGAGRGVRRRRGRRRDCRRSSWMSGIAPARRGLSPAKLSHGVRFSRPRRRYVDVDRRRDDRRQETQGTGPRRRFWGRAALVLRRSPRTRRPASALQWNLTQLPEESTALYGASCPSPTLCVVVGSNGALASSTNPTGGAGTWLVTPLRRRRRSAPERPQQLLRGRARCAASPARRPNSAPRSAGRGTSTPRPTPAAERRPGRRSRCNPRKSRGSTPTASPAPRSRSASGSRPAARSSPRPTRRARPSGA